MNVAELWGLMSLLNFFYRQSHDMIAEFLERIRTKKKNISLKIQRSLFLQKKKGKRIRKK